MKINTFKKGIALIYFVLLLASFVTPTTTLAVAPPNAEDYHLLAPFDVDGGITDIDPGQKNALGVYLNLMLKIFIGLCATMAVFMIVMGGIEYMTSELVHSKEAGKEKIRNALLGLILALGSYALLYTINPDLLNTDIYIPDTEIAYADEANFAKTEQSITTAGKGYTLSGSPSAGVSNFVINQLSQKPLRAIVVDTATKRAYFYVGPEGDWSQFVSVPVNLGQGGVAEAGQAKPGDLKTPKGISNISGDVRFASNGNAVTSIDGKFNLGAAFINTGIAGRGIGFHGSTNNSLGTTNGCIRMGNDDLVALARYMKPGVQVLIK